MSDKMYFFLMFVCACVIASVFYEGPTIGDTNSGRQQQYAAWVRVYHREDVTFDDWNTLRIGNFLPTNCECGK